MQKQILKGVTMLMIIAAVALMAALVSAHAQTSGSVAADIPFDFAVGSKSLKAGEYYVRAFTASGDTLLVSSKDRNDAAVRLSNSIRASTPQKGKLVFHRYGQRYFLSEVWAPGQQTGRQLLKSSAERELEKQLAAISSKSELAGSGYETIEIVAMVR
jgi:hypothetical protein